MIDNFLSEAYQRLGRCGQLFKDNNGYIHICNNDINHEGNHQCSCTEEWPQIQIKRSQFNEYN